MFRNYYPTTSSAATTLNGMHQLTDCHVKLGYMGLNCSTMNEWVGHSKANSGWFLLGKLMKLSLDHSHGLFVGKW